MENIAGKLTNIYATFGVNKNTRKTKKRYEKPCKKHPKEVIYK